MGAQNPRRYTSEFKRQAVELAKELGSTSKAAKQLGISDGNIHNWRQRFKAEGSLENRGQNSVSNTQNTESPEEELKRLRRENQQLQKTNYILKQAAAFFSQDHLK